MAEVTAISWTDHTYNPWIGCTRVSLGCDHCYAEADWDKRYHRVEWGGARSRTKSEGPANWDRKAREAGVRRRVFCASLADVFDNQVPDEWRADLWDLIDRCRALDWMLLTKRPQNIANMLPSGWPWPHVWLGTTTENQIEANRRLPILLRIPAVVHFASVEPQLGPVDLRSYLNAGLDWIIIGGESGPGCRPFDSDWARDVRDQCQASGIAFFMKQLGGVRNKRHHLDDLPADLRVREWPNPCARPGGGSISARPP
jgi:protein gp37